MEWTQFVVTVLTTLAPVILGYLQLRSSINVLKTRVEFLEKENEHLKIENEDLTGRIKHLERENRELCERLASSRPGNRL